MTLNSVIGIPSQPDSDHNMTIPLPSHQHGPSSSSSSSPTDTQNTVNKKSRSQISPKPKLAVSNTTLGLSAGPPGPSGSSPSSPTIIADKYRSRARTSSIDFGSDPHSSEARRRNSSSDRLANNSNNNNNTNQRVEFSSPGAGPSKSVRRHETRPHRSSTLTTTTTLASSGSRPLLRSRASTNARLSSEAISLGSPPSSPTNSTASSTKSRRRAMSSSPRTGRQTHPYRKAIIIFSILVSLFLVGTVIVLSSVRYYLAIPDGAFLTEEEVPWTGEDLIAPLKEPEQLNLTMIKRQGWAELGNEGGVLGAETIPEVWNEMDPDTSDETASTITPPVEANSDYTASSSSIESTNDVAWGIDGQGSGAYWMREDWDGVVRDADNWDRLYNITARPGEKIPRIIHQTWKNDQLPEKWRKAWRECREGMQDYEYMLWTDDLAHKFMEVHYPSFLQMYDSYKYNIQRADSIRYFLLHHFGGIYMDLDIGCRRRMDELIQGDWEVILPLTKPVGISNDLIFSSKGSAFIADTIHGLAAFNHEWFSNYPTVMFSTGPMFLSAQYAIYTSAHPLSETHQRHEIRVLPKSLYGKNADPATVPHSFFAHFYGSSWHDGDAGFIGFLGKSGILVMWIAAIVVVLLIARLGWQRYKGTSSSAGQYQLLNGSLPMVSPLSHLTSPGTNPFHVDQNQLSGGDISNAFKRAGNLILTAPATLLSSRGRRRQGLLYFVPAMFQPTPAPSNRRRTASEASQLPMTVRRTRHDSGSGSGSDTEPHIPPPPYQRESQDWTLQSGQHDRAVPKTQKAGSSSSLTDEDEDLNGSYSATTAEPEQEREWETWKETR